MTDIIIFDFKFFKVLGKPLSICKILFIYKVLIECSLLIILKRMHGLEIHSLFFILMLSSAIRSCKEDVTL